MAWHIISNSFRLASPICCFILEVPEVHRLPSLWQWELPTCRQCQMNFLSQNPWQNSPGRQQSSTCGLQGSVQLLQLHKRGIGPTISDTWNPMKCFFTLKPHDFHDYFFSFFPQSSLSDGLWIEFQVLNQSCLFRKASRLILSDPRERYTAQLGTNLCWDLLVQP